MKTKWDSSINLEEWTLDAVDDAEEAIRYIVKRGVLRGAKEAIELALEDSSGFWIKELETPSHDFSLVFCLSLAANTDEISSLEFSFQELLTQYIDGVCMRDANGVWLCSEPEVANLHSALERCVAYIAQFLPKNALTERESHENV